MEEFIEWIQEKRVSTISFIDDNTIEIYTEAGPCFKYSGGNLLEALSDAVNDFSDMEE